MANVANPGANPAARRGLWLSLLAGAAGAGLVLLAAGQPWARAWFAPAPPMPTSSVTMTGHELAPAANALGFAALACLAAVLATRGAARRVSGGVLAVLGALVAVTVAVSVSHAHVAATAAAHALPGTAGAAGATAPRLAMAGFPWWAACVGGGLLSLAAGVATAWRGPRWPAMSSKYSGPGATPGPAAGRLQAAADDQVTAWDALDRGADPTLGRPPPDTQPLTQPLTPPHAPPDAPPHPRSAPRG